MEACRPAFYAKKYKAEQLMYIVANCCERQWASSQESLFPQSYGTFKQRDISATIDFFSICSIEQKMFSFEDIIDIRDEPARPGRNALWRVISQLFRKIQIRNFNTMCVSVLKLSYEILNNKYLLALELSRFS